MKRTFLKYRSSLLLLLVFLAVTSILRIHLLSIPLERDEGEYAYSGQLILQGIPPFSQAYNMKMPGIYLAYAAILACFGQTAAGIHFGLLLVNLLCSLAVYFIGKRLYNPEVGISAAVAFAGMSLSSSVLGLAADAEHFVLVFALFGIFLLLKAVRKESIALFLPSGFLLGACFLMKQHGAVFVVFGFLFLVWHGGRKRTGRWGRFDTSVAVFCAGCATPLMLVCIWMWHAGVFGRFWFWTFTYAQAYVSQVPLWVGAHLFLDAIGNIVSAAPIYWLLGFAGLCSMLFDKSSRAKSLFVVSFLCLSFASICPGLYFREQYFVLMLPAVSLLCGIGINAALSLMEKRHLPHSARPFVFGAIVSIAFAIPLFVGRTMLFGATPIRVSRLVYWLAPFPESCVIADSLERWSLPNDKIGILGSEPQIFFYAHRKSASGYIYTYALMEKHPFALQMQNEMIGQIEAAKPKYLVYVNSQGSWLMRPYSCTKIFEWFNHYQKESYEIAGVADIVSAEKTVYVWGEDARKYSPRASNWVAIFRRKSPG
jgi:4-amino-4-deoxy-L-arabinose transferase-like glycosyltransferase